MGAMGDMAGYCVAIAITLMSFALPLTAAIVNRGRGNGNGSNGYSTKELARMEGKLNTLCTDVTEMKGEVRRIWVAISP